MLVERGKACLVLAKETEDAAEYVWYTRMCGEVHKFICEDNQSKYGKAVLVEPVFIVFDI